MSNNKDQQHPQEHKDQEIIASLFEEKPNNQNLTELARLRIRYLNFPGAREIQNNIDKIMELWGFNEEELYEKTRKIYANTKKVTSLDGEIEQEHWS